jgi:hypothetical protein
MRARFRSSICELERHQHSHTLLLALSRRVTYSEIGIDPTVFTGSKRQLPYGKSLSWRSRRDRSPRSPETVRSAIQRSTSNERAAFKSRLRSSTSLAKRAEFRVAGLETGGTGCGIACAATRDGDCSRIIGFSARRGCCSCGPACRNRLATLSAENVEWFDLEDLARPTGGHGPARSPTLLRRRRVQIFSARP